MEETLQDKPRWTMEMINPLRPGTIFDWGFLEEEGKWAAVKGIGSWGIRYGGVDRDYRQIAISGQRMYDREQAQELIKCDDVMKLNYLA